MTGEGLEPDPGARVRATGSRAIPAAVRIACIAALLGLSMRIFILQPVSVPSESMEPALLPGDLLIAEKYPYGYSSASLPWTSRVDPEASRIGLRLPRRGDVVIFADPRNSGDYYVKRVAGLPGETLSLENGDLIVDGRLVALAARANALDARANVAAVRIPEGMLFVLGDNRAKSLDSRFSAADGGFGFVPLSALVGRAGPILFSIAPPGEDGWFSRLRLSRIGKRP